MLQIPLLNYVDWLFRFVLNEGELEVKFVLCGILFNIQQEIIQVVEQTPLKKNGVSWAVVRGIKMQRLVADHSPSYSAEVQHQWSRISTIPMHS